MKHFHLCHTTNGDKPWQLHKADCKDVYRMVTGVTAIHLNSRPTRYEGTDAAAVVKQMLGDAAIEGSIASMGYTTDDVRIMPCCKQASETLDMSMRFRLK
jgi:hypothetical protein